MPDVPNAESTNFTNIETIEGDYVNGTTVEIVCSENYTQVETQTVCGVDGKWTPQIECYPGLKQCFIFRNNFSSFVYI